MSAVYGEYVTFKHVKTRKVVVLEIEVPEENFQNVITLLGMPVGGESKPVGIALLDKAVMKQEAPKAKVERSLSQQAYLLSQRGDFISYTQEMGYEDSNKFILTSCGITSKSELDTNLIAAELYKTLEVKFDSWKVDRNYKDFYR